MKYIMFFIMFFLMSCGFDLPEKANYFGKDKNIFILKYEEMHSLNSSTIDISIVLDKETGVEYLIFEKYSKISATPRIKK